MDEYTRHPVATWPWYACKAMSCQHMCIGHPFKLSVRSGPHSAYLLLSRATISRGGAQKCFAHRSALQEMLEMLEMSEMLAHRSALQRAV